MEDPMLPDRQANNDHVCLIHDAISTADILIARLVALSLLWYFASLARAIGDFDLFSISLRIQPGMYLGTARTGRHSTSSTALWRGSRCHLHTRNKKLEQEAAHCYRVSKEQGKSQRAYSCLQTRVPLTRLGNGLGKRSLK